MKRGAAVLSKWQNLWKKRIFILLHISALSINTFQSELPIPYGFTFFNRTSDDAYTHNIAIQWQLHCGTILLRNWTFVGSAFRIRNVKFVENTMQSVIVLDMNAKVARWMLCCVRNGHTSSEWVICDKAVSCCKRMVTCVAATDVVTLSSHEPEYSEYTEIVRASVFRISTSAYCWIRQMGWLFLAFVFVPSMCTTKSCTP